MREVTKLKIRISDLTFAWQDEHQDNSYYLDKETGSVQLVNRHLLDLRDLTDDIEKDRERYLYLPKPDPKQLRSDLTDFVDAVDDEPLKRVLEAALESPNALSAIQQVLGKDPSKMVELNNFLASRTFIRIRQWLQANSLEEETPGN